MLSDQSEYEGGGTYIHALRRTVILKKGQVLVHPGELYHKGVDITSGERRLVICFMDGYNPGVVDDVIPDTDKDSAAIARFEENRLVML